MSNPVRNSTGTLEDRKVDQVKLCDNKELNEDTHSCNIVSIV